MTLARFWTLTGPATQIRPDGGKPDGGKPSGGAPGQSDDPSNGPGGGPFKNPGGGWGKGGKGGGGGGGAASMFAVTRQLSPAATGTQDYTVEGFGTPSGAIVIASQAVSDGVAANHWNQSLGATDGTNHWSLNHRLRSALGSQEVARSCTKTNVLEIMDRGGSGTTKDVSATASLIEDGVRLSFTVDESVQVLVTVVLIHGDADVDVGVFTPALIDSETTITTGFEMDWALFATPNVFGSQSFSSAGSGGAPGVGIAQWDGVSVAQGCVHNAASNGAVDGETNGRISNTGVVNSRPNSTLTIIQNVTATGFDAHQDGSSEWLSGGEVGYIAIGGLTDSWAGILDSPTATGVDNITGVGFEPTFGLVLTSMMTAINTAYLDNAVAGACGISVFTGSGAEFSTCWANERASDPTDTQSLADDQAIYLTDDAGVETFAAAFDAWTADGVDLDYSAADGTARKWLGLFAV